MGESWRSLTGLVALTFRAARRQAVAYYVMTVATELCLLASLIGIKLLLDAAVRADAGDTAVAAAMVAGLGYVATVVGRSQFRRAATMIEKTMVFLDEELMALTTGIQGIGHHETPEHADRIALVVEQRRTPAYAAFNVAQLLRSTVQLGGSIFLLSLMHPVLVLLPLFGVASMLAQGRAQRLLNGALQTTAEDARHRQQLVALATSAPAGKELRLFGLDGELLRRHREAGDRVAAVRNGAGVRAAALQGAGRLTFAVGYVAAAGLVLREALDGRATPGDVVLAVTLASSINTRVAMAADEFGFLGKAIAIGRHLLWLRDRATPGAPRTSPVPHAIGRGIRVDRVTFAYPGATGPALHDVSLDLPAGSVVALVGENGSGKTTLVKLLTGMYEPSEGTISVDGVDLSTIEPDTWRRRTSAAFQDFCRFELLVRESIGVGDVDRVDDPVAVVAAVDRAGAGDVVSGLPRGLDAQLGRAWGGAELSGGQWQKVALARGLMRPAPMLTVFDEPTAALDPLSEHALFERFAASAREPERCQSITLLVSHRFSTVRMADRIVVLDGGRVKETGSHAELVAQGGLYAELYSLQAHALLGPA